MENSRCTLQSPQTMLDLQHAVLHRCDVEGSCGSVGLLLGCLFR